MSGQETAREKFRAGQRVVATREYRRQFPDGPTTGIVAGFSRKYPGFVMVLAGDNNTPQTYGSGFWLPDPDDPVARLRQALKEVGVTALLPDPAEACRLIRERVENALAEVPG